MWTLGRCSLHVKAGSLPFGLGLTPTPFITSIPPHRIQTTGLPSCVCKNATMSRDLLGFRSVSLRLSVHEDGPRADLFQNRSDERGSPRDRNGVSLNAQSLCSMRCFSPSATKIEQSLERSNAWSSGRRSISADCKRKDAASAKIKPKT
jgi:hypothetical protein